MNDPVLRSRNDVDSVLADLFGAHADSASGEFALRLDVYEDRCFKNERRVSVGEIVPYPELPNASQEGGGGNDILSRAFRHGFFEWRLPSRKAFQEELSAALGVEGVEDGESSGRTGAGKDEHIVGEVAKAVAHIAIRCGLAHPVFDPMALARMPFLRPVSVVVDTSAVLQGGLDFLARHLTPAARIKVPALVHMEILNLVDRYFSRRRKGASGARMLLDHVSSQGGQRVLLRLEMNNGVEFERPRLGADPLRGIVQPDSDPEDRNLGLQIIQRSFADRLVLETTIQHRDRVGPDHSVMLMTSDQGLARMALTEGIEPIFFDSNAVSYLLGTALSGVTFRPFATGDARLLSSSITDVLWECAVAFGSARLTSDDTEAAFEVTSMGGDAVWSPYHSREDLLWTRTCPASEKVSFDTKPYPLPEKPSHEQTKVKDGESVGRTGRASRGTVRRPLTGAYSFNLASMLNLVETLERVGSLSDEAGVSIAGVKTDSAYGQYWKFLVAGRFADRRNDRLEGTDRLTDFIKAMRGFSFDDMKSLLVDVPAFKQFLEKLKVGTPLTRAASGIRTVAFPTHCALAELCCAGARADGDGIHATPNNPTPAGFVQPALDAYNAVRAGEDFALTGDWLGRLATHSGIHPVYARQRLAEAHQGGYLRRYFEGSTPETRYESRNIQVLDVEGGDPVVRKINLYHGDFLMPGRAAVSIKLLPGGDT